MTSRRVASALLALFALVTGPALAGEAPKAPQALDPAPFHAALQAHVNAKLNDSLVDDEVERRVRSQRLVADGADKQLVRDLVEAHRKAQEKGGLKQQLVKQGVEAEVLDQLLAEDLPADQLAALTAKALEQGGQQDVLDDLLEAKAAPQRRDDLKRQLIEQGVKEQALDDLLHPPSPIQVKVERLEQLSIEDVGHLVRSPVAGRPGLVDVEHVVKTATAEAHVSITESTPEGERVGKGVWENVRFELKKGKAGEAPAWQVADIKVPGPGLGKVGFAVLFVYLLAMLAIGWWTSRFIKSTRSFFIADGRLNWFVVGVSILTAYLSALTMMALPGVSFRKLDWLYAFQLPFLVITAFVITRFVLQRYRDAGVISVYQYLEERIHVSARLLASLSFIVFSIGRMGLVLFLPALAFSMVTGANLLTTIIVMGAVVTIYTVMGGMEAVIWTDFAQAIVMLVGAGVSVVYILAGTGAGDFTRIATEHHKFRMVAGGLDVTQLITIWLVLETIFQTIRIYGTQQDIAQRYMTTPSTAKANRSVWIAILGYIPLGFLFYFVGSALFVYYKAHPDTSVAALVINGRADSIYPYFVAKELPPALAGLVIAAIFAAAMSSIDACMNASSTVCVEDFYRRFRRQDLPDRHHLNVARLLTVFWGVLATLMAIYFIRTRTAQIMWGKVMGISTNGVLGLMALAFLPRKVNKWAAVLGFLSSYLVLFAVMWFIQIGPTFAITYPVEGAKINFLLWPVIGNTWCFLVALVLDLFMPSSGGEAEPAAQA